MYTNICKWIRISKNVKKHFENEPFADQSCDYSLTQIFCASNVIGETEGDSPPEANDL